MSWTESKWCRYCRRQRLVFKTGRIRHGFVHFLLCILTLGLWFPVFCVILVVGSWSCSRCGELV